MTKSKDPAAASACSPGAENSSAPVLLNALSFTTPILRAEASFTTRRLAGMHRFTADEVPHSLLQELPGCDPAPVLYTRFNPGEDGITVTFALNEYPALARAWLSDRIGRMLAPHTAYCRPWNRDATQYWCAGTHNPADEHILCCHRFTLQVENGQGAGAYKLLIRYDGPACILRQSIGQLHDRVPDTRLFRQVAFHGRIYNWDRLPPNAHYHPAVMFPVLNAALAGALGIALPHDDKEQVYSGFRQNVCNFIESHCFREEFRSLVQHDGHLIAVASEDIGRLPDAFRRLQFGEGRLHTQPEAGMRRYGPWRRPPGSHFRYFFIYSERHSREARQLLVHLTGGSGLPHLNRLTCLPMTHSPGHNIVLPDDGDPVAQMEEALQQASYDSGVTWFAFFLSPRPHHEQDIRRRQLYFRITELLLWKQISVQTVNVDTVRNHFDKAIGNIVSAVVGKLGGIPWLPGGFNRCELVVGFGTDREENPLLRYMASAVCMMQEGQFSRFEVFRAADVRAMAGTAVAAYERYRDRYPDLRRLVIHTCSTPALGFMEMLGSMADEVEPGLPVVVMTIRQCRRGLLPFYSQEENPMLPDGTWVRCSNATWLVAVNGRRHPEQQYARQVFPLKIDIRCNRAGYLNGKGVVSELLSTVYAFTRIQWHSHNQQFLPATLAFPSRLAARIPGFRSKMLPAQGQELLWFL